VGGGEKTEEEESVLSVLKIILKMFECFFVGLHF